MPTQGTKDQMSPIGAADPLGLMHDQVTGLKRSAEDLPLPPPY